MFRAASRKNVLAISVFIAFFALAVTRFWYPQESFFELQAILESICRLTMGSLVIIVAVFKGSLIIYALLLITIGIVFSLAIKVWSKISHTTKYTILMLVLINFIIGIYFAAPSLPGSKIFACEVPISETHRIRVSTYEKGYGTHTFFVVLANTEENSLQFLDYVSENIFLYKCENVNSLDSQFIWVWTPSKLAISYDKGNIWNIKSIHDIYPYLDYRYVKGIETVKFEDTDRGQIHLEIDQISGFTNFVLYTSDGGQSWYK